MTTAPPNQPTKTGWAMTLAEPPDTRQGWCCDGRTWKEHADAEGHCCQPEGRQLEELPEDGQEKARERLSGAV
jgi:hypothetical protein